MYTHEAFAYTKEELHSLAKVNEFALDNILSTFIKYEIIKKAKEKYIYSDSAVAKMLGNDLLTLSKHVNEIDICEESLEKKVE